MLNRGELERLIVDAEPLIASEEEQNCRIEPR
jgi:hypothetical protein